MCKQKEHGRRIQPASDATSETQRVARLRTAARPQGELHPDRMSTVLEAVLPVFALTSVMEPV